jgi:hypothetical protein
VNVRQFLFSTFHYSSDFRFCCRLIRFDISRRLWIYERKVNRLGLVLSDDQQLFLQPSFKCFDLCTSLRTLHMVCGSLWSEPSHQ